MNIHTVDEAGKILGSLLEATSQDDRPIFIRGEQASGVLVSEEDWNAIQETLSLMSIPGMAESIRDGVATPLSECSDRVEW